MKSQESVRVICKNSLKLIHEYLSKIKTIKETKHFFSYNSIIIIRKALKCKIP